MAFYLKYRPQKIKELDLESVRLALTEALKAKEVAHAFLFVGPKGTGKTSSARIVARSVNCVKRKSNQGEPCLKCEMCKNILNAKTLDLIEIDAASNRGIDDIRDLKAKINLTPSRAKIKVYIIDEVHMLTTEAFNALLKTLEEPPSHAMFVLCTTEPQKLPETITSRCFRVSFNKATEKEIVRSLSRVVKGEKIKINKKDLLVIANKANGSFRDAVKILEQLASVGKSISRKRVKSVLKRGLEDGSIDDWLVLIINQKVDKALDWLSQVVNKGADVRQLARESVERLRQLLMIKLEVEKGDDLFKEQTVEVVKQLTFYFHQAAREIKGAVIESLPLELMIVEWSSFNKDKAAAADDDEREALEEEKVPKTTNLKKSSGKLSIAKVTDKWQEVLKALKPHNHSLEALLKATKPSGFDGGVLVLEVFYKFHKERLEDDRYRQLVETVASEILSKPVKVRYLLGDKVRTVENKNSQDDNVSGKIDKDIIKTAEEVFGVEVN